jgi:hypothetical protein
MSRVMTSISRSTKKHKKGLLRLPDLNQFKCTILSWPARETQGGWVLVFNAVRGGNVRSCLTWLQIFFNHCSTEFIKRIGQSNSE